MFFSAVAVVHVGAEVEVLWNGFRGGPAATAWRRFESAAADEPRPAWTFRGSDVVWNYAPGVSVWSSPAVAQIGERVVCFVGSYDRNVYALDVATGRELWRFTTGDGVYSTPAVVRDGDRYLVFVGSSDRTLYCLDGRRGIKLWAYELYEWRQSLGRAFVSSPLVLAKEQGPSVVVVSWVYDTAPKGLTEVADIWAFALDGGKPLWRRRFAHMHPTHPVAGQVEGRWRIYVGCRDGNLYCLDGASGREVWRRRSKFPVDGAPSFLGGRGDAPALVLVGSKFGDVRAFDAATGKIAWSFKVRHWVDATPAIVRGPGGRDLAVFGSYYGRLYCVDARTGKLQWRYNTRGNIVASAAVIPRGESFEIYVPSDDDMLHAVDGRTGRAMWRISPGPFLWAYSGLGDTIWASPVAVEVGDAEMLIVPFYDGRVHGYRLDRREAWAAERGSRAYGRAMLGRIVASMAATLALALFFVRAEAAERKGAWTWHRR